VIGTDRTHRPAAHNDEGPAEPDEAFTAVAVTASLLTSLSRRELSPRNSRVVIIGSATVPVLRPLLMATGLAEIISWDRHDAGTFPLHWVLRNADAVIDLTDCTQEL